MLTLQTTAILIILAVPLVYRASIKRRDAASRLAVSVWQERALKSYLARIEAEERLARAESEIIRAEDEWVDSMVRLSFRTGSREN